MRRRKAYEDELGAFIFGGTGAIRASQGAKCWLAQICFLEQGRGMLVLAVGQHILETAVALLVKLFLDSR